MSYVIRGLAFHEAGVTFDYVIPEEDVKSNGLLFNRVLLVPATDEFAEVLDNLIDALHHALTTALTSFRDTPAADDVDPGEDDEPSPYDNPLERALPTPADTTQEGDRP